MIRAGARARAAALAAALFAPAIARARPVRLDPGGEIAASALALSVERSTGDGRSWRLAPGLRVLLGSAVSGPVGVAAGVRYLTYASDGASGTVSVDARHHVLSAGPHLCLSRPGLLARAFAEAVADLARPEIAARGQDARTLSATRAGFAYGAALAAASRGLALGVEAARAHRGTEAGWQVALTAGWIWGGLARADQ